jgi:hypothetical protein
MMTEFDPATTSPVCDPDWKEIFDVYSAGLPLKPIAEKFQIHVQKISAHAKREGWTRHPAGAKRDLVAAIKKPTASSQGTMSLMKRLTGLVERQIAEIEVRLAEKTEARDHERDARTLSNLTRTLEKLVDLRRGVEEEKAEKRRLARKENATKEKEADADVIRANLARRLVRITSASTSN